MCALARACSTVLTALIRHPASLRPSTLTAIAATSKVGGCTWRVCRICMPMSVNRSIRENRRLWTRANSPHHPPKVESSPRELFAEREQRIYIGYLYVVLPLEAKLVLQLRRQPTRAIELGDARYFSSPSTSRARVRARTRRRRVSRANLRIHDAEPDRPRLIAPVSRPGRRQMAYSHTPVIAERHWSIDLGRRLSLGRMIVC
jgi:hypothetical protein